MYHWSNENEGASEGVCEDCCLEPPGTTSVKMVKSDFNVEPLGSPVQTEEPVTNGCWGFGNPETMTLDSTTNGP